MQTKLGNFSVSTHYAFPANSLAALLAAGVAKRPHEAAILNMQESYSFSELDQLSNAAACHLRETFGVRLGDRVLVLAHRALEIVPLAIAIWKAGAVYVPVDVASPPKRLEHILASIRPVLVVSGQQQLQQAGSSLAGLSTWSYEALTNLKGTPSNGPTWHAAGDDAPALIIHTSGSTGTPKGVVLSHDSVLTYLRNHNDVLGFDTGSRGINSGPFHFDVSIQDTFLPLYFAATVVFHGGLFVSAVMTSLIRNQRITHLIAVSSVLALISKDESRLATLRCSDLQVVVTGGEVCPPKLINRWLTAIPGIRVLYGYGPTEANSICTTHIISEPEIGRQEPYPIGLPFKGMKAILLDDNRGVIEGENKVGVLALSGPQLMLGYWRDPELTARVLLPWRGEAYYITGDRCFRDTHSRYHFAGRRDTEVKIRGYRINLNEVRNALLDSEQVCLALVTTIEGDGETRIAGFVNTASVADFDEAALRRDLAQRVPDYMCPWYLCVSDTLARTSTDKVDETLLIARMRELVATHPNQRLLRLDWRSPVTETTR
jgi:amino acid adenylation domain-containing protein